MLHVICTRLRLGHLSVRVGDSSRRCEEIVKKSRIAPLNAIIIIIINLTGWVHAQTVGPTDLNVRQRPTSLRASMHGNTKLYVTRGRKNQAQLNHERTATTRGNTDIFVVCCLTPQQHVCVPQGRICSDNFTCCHTETEVADQTFHLTQSQYTDTGSTSPSTDPITPGAWQGSH